MKYCCTELERKGTCYHEFQRGKFNDSFWYSDSILIHDDTLNILQLAELFRSVVPSYNYYGETEITPKQWEEIHFKGSEIEGEVKIAIDEINDWVKDVFETEMVFTILGI